MNCLFKYPILRCIDYVALLGDVLSVKEQETMMSVKHRPCS